MARKEKVTRARRAKRTRKRIRELEMPKLSVHRTPRHIYAQVISSDGERTVASASTLEGSIRRDFAYGGNCVAAAMVGRSIAEKALQVGVKKVAFDRSGFRFHGRVKALAEAARGAGLKF